VKRVDFKKISVFEGPEKSPGFLLWHVSTSWRGEIENSLKPFGLTHPQFVVIACLGWLTKNGDRVSQAILGKWAGLDPNTLSQILTGLEKKGFVKREPSSDARAKNPVLTLEGKAALEKALPAVESADAQFFNALSNSDLGKLIEVFITLRNC